MSDPPRRMGGAKMICFAILRVHDEVSGTSPHRASSIRGLAIAHAPEGYSLFGCDADWQVISDTWHETLDEAKAQAAFEFPSTPLLWSEKSPID